MMKLAFCLFKYFPYGGLQRDFLRVARTCQQRGHEIDVYTMHWEDKLEPGWNIHTIQVYGWQNHTLIQSYVDKVQEKVTQKKYDVVIGFNKMPFLDLYYAADICYQARIKQQRGLLYRLSPRCRQLIAYEEAVFNRGNKTQILLISPAQQAEFSRYYQTETERFHILPPGIAKDRMAPDNASEIRRATRKSLQLDEDALMLLLVGSGFKTKGLDRAIHALASLPEEIKTRTHLFILGQDNPVPFQKLAKRLQVSSKVIFFGGRTDVPQFLLAADLLLHPAYYENTGTVLLEAMMSALPVLTVDTCGYAHYINEAKCGMVLPSPFQQELLNTQLLTMLTSSERTIWGQNGLVYAKHADIYSMPDKAVELIENYSRGLR